MILIERGLCDIFAHTHVLESLRRRSIRSSRVTRMILLEMGICLNVFTVFQLILIAYKCGNLCAYWKNKIDIIDLKNALSTAHCYAHIWKTTLAAHCVSAQPPRLLLIRYKSDSDRLNNHSD